MTETKGIIEKPSFSSEGQTLVPQAASSTQVAQSREVARIQAMTIMAMRNPRDEALCMQRIERACARHTLAEVAVYNYARGATNVVGPSIRLAEALAIAWGNIQSGTEVIESTDKYSKVRAYAVDLETNVLSERIFEVRHERDTKKGRVELRDNRDVMELINNIGSRNIRTCILRLIPGDVVDYAVAQCQKTLASNIVINAENIKKLQTSFKDTFGVSKKALEAFIQRKLEAITPPLYLKLRGTYASLRDGIESPENVFDMTLVDDEVNQTITGNKKSVKKETPPDAPEKESRKEETKPSEEIPLEEAVKESDEIDESDIIPPEEYDNFDF